MGLLHAIKQFFADAKLVTRSEDLAPGQVAVDGTVRLGAAGPMTSPLKGAPCVAFLYVATHKTPGRGGGQIERPLRTVERFHAFELEVDGVRLEAVPQTPGAFTRDDHQALADAGYHDFQASEELVPPRARVRVRGVAKRRGEGWVLTYRRIELLEAQPGGKKKPRRR